jgi:hypothetical protein
MMVYWRIERYCVLLCIIAPHVLVVLKSERERPC